MARNDKFESGVVSDVTIRTHRAQQSDPITITTSGTLPSGRKITHQSHLEEGETATPPFDNGDRLIVNRATRCGIVNIETGQWYPAPEMPTKIKEVLLQLILVISIGIGVYSQSIWTSFLVFSGLVIPTALFYGCAENEPNFALARYAEKQHPGIFTQPKQSDN